jgi:hypothetical protein
MQNGCYVLAFSILAAALIIAYMDRRAGWRDGVEFARRIAHREACTSRALYNAAMENGYTKRAENINAQVDVLRSLEMQLRWEMASRFMKADNPDQEG